MRRARRRDGSQRVFASGVPDYAQRLNRRAAERGVSVVV